MRAVALDRDSGADEHQVANGKEGRNYQAAQQAPLANFTLPTPTPEVLDSLEASLVFSGRHVSASVTAFSVKNIRTLASTIIPGTNAQYFFNAPGTASGSAGEFALRPSYRGFGGFANASLAVLNDNSGVEIGDVPAMVANAASTALLS